jgi:hypothetical protein
VVILVIMDITALCNVPNRKFGNTTPAKIEDETHVRFGTKVVCSFSQKECKEASGKIPVHHRFALLQHDSCLIMIVANKTVVILVMKPSKIYKKLSRVRAGAQKTKHEQHAARSQG